MGRNASPRVSRTRAAFAGVAAALVWGAAEPVDRRLLRYGYSDIALLGKLVTRGPSWRIVGFTLHALNGAVFGFVWREVDQRHRTSPLTFALVEHLALFPLGALVDRHHPARGTPGVPRIFTARAFAQAAFRHALFGWVLGRIARVPAPPPPAE